MYYIGVRARLRLRGLSKVWVELTLLGFELGLYGFKSYTGLLIMSGRLARRLQSVLVLYIFNQSGSINMALDQSVVAWCLVELGTCAN